MRSTMERLAEPSVPIADVNASASSAAAAGADFTFRVVFVPMASFKQVLRLTATQRPTITFGEVNYAGEEEMVPTASSDAAADFLTHLGPSLVNEFRHRRR